MQPHHRSNYNGVF